MRKRLWLPRQANGEMQGGCSSATAALLHLTSRGQVAGARQKRNAQAPMSAPTSKWENARGLLFGHRCFTPFDLEGQYAGTGTKK